MIIACGGDASNNQSASDQRQSSSSQQSTPSSDPIYTWDGPAKAQLLSLRHNIPDPENKAQYIYSLDVPEEMKANYREIHQVITKYLGSYRNYVSLVFNENGTVADAKPVFDALNTLPYADAAWDANFKFSTIEQLIDEKSCLSGGNKGEARTATTDIFSMCFQSLQFAQNPFNEQQRPETRERKLGKLVLHQAHEYFHHYQRAHALDRGMDYQLDLDNPETTLQNPPWWTEGAAVAFQNAWYREYWDELSFFEGNSWSDVNVSIQEFTSSSQFKEVRRAIMGGPAEGRGKDCTPDFTMGPWTEQYDTERAPEADKCQAFMLGVPYIASLTSWKTVWIDIPQDYYDLGFWGSFEKHIGMTKLEFYDNFNVFLRAGDPEDEPPPGWQPQIGPFINYADFLLIVPEAD